MQQTERPFILWFGFDEGKIKYHEENDFGSAL